MKLKIYIVVLLLSSIFCYSTPPCWLSVLQDLVIENKNKGLVELLKKDPVAVYAFSKLYNANIGSRNLKGLCKNTDALKALIRANTKNPLKVILAKDTNVLAFSKLYSKIDDIKVFNKFIDNGVLERIIKSEHYDELLKVLTAETKTIKSSFKSHLDELSTQHIEKIERLIGNGYKHPKFDFYFINNLAEGGGDILTKRKTFWNDWINKCFPDKNWTNTTFETVGKDYNAFKNSNSVIDNEMRAMYNSVDDADNFLPRVLNSGSTNPVIANVNQGDKLYKIVPKGGNINSPSPYYLSQADYNWIKANPSQLEQKLGLPLSSVSNEYDVFTITSKVNNNKLFQSTVAPTKQFSNSTPNVIYNTTGGRTQSLIINNGDNIKWIKSSSPIETLSPNSLPVIGN